MFLNIGLKIQPPVRNDMEHILHHASPISVVCLLFLSKIRHCTKTLRFAEIYSSLLVSTFRVSYHQVHTSCFGSTELRVGDSGRTRSAALKMDTPREMNKQFTWVVWMWVCLI